MRPVKHEHILEVKIPESTQDKIDKAHEHLRVNKRAYLFGIGGVVIGVVGTRLFAHPAVNVEVIVNKD